MPEEARPLSEVEEPEVALRVVEPVVVTILGVKGHTITEIREFAIDVAGERGRNFGANVKVYGNLAQVSIHRD